MIARMRAEEEQNARAALKSGKQRRNEARYRKCYRSPSLKLLKAPTDFQSVTLKIGGHLIE